MGRVVSDPKETERATCSMGFQPMHLGRMSKSFKDSFALQPCGFHVLPEAIVIWLHLILSVECMGRMPMLQPDRLIE